ncbi:MAG: hypothetical protein AAFO95_07715 [Cyanobacteria bacterium J06600_6]
MLNSLSTYLNTIEAELKPDIIKPQNWQNIQAIANIFPQLITSFFGFEYRLGDTNAYSDFLLCIDGEEAGKKILGDRQNGMQLPDHLIEQPEWQQLFNFAQLWCADNSLLGDLVSNMWLEFDIEPTPTDTPIPSVFFGLQPPEITDAKHDASNFAWIADTALPLLLNRPVAARVKEKIELCFASLPVSAHVFQVGLMLSRQTDAVRLCIRNLQPSEIIPWLEQLGWQGDSRNLALVLRKLAPFVDRIDLDLDVGEDIYPKIGLECYLAMQPTLEPKWACFLEYLVGLGLCTAEKQHKLLTYPGYVRERGFKSKQKLKLEQLLNSKQETVFFNGIHHVKLSYQERVTEAKAYLYVSRSQINVQEFNARAKAIQGVNK